MKKYISEALGTFSLTLVVALSLTGSFPVSTAILAALTVGLFVYAVGPISGGHVNPAVTIGLWSIKKIDGKETLYYIISQLIGATAACVLSSYIFQVQVIHVNGVEVVKTALAEFIGMFFFGFFIASFVGGKVAKELSGVFIAGSLLLGIAVSSLLGSEGIINPAVALGIGSYGFAYLLAPLIGSIFGMKAFKYLDK